MTLDRYVFRMLLTRTVVAVVVLVGLSQVLELLDKTTEILQRGEGLAGIGHYSLLRLAGAVAAIQWLRASWVLGAISAATTKSSRATPRATGSIIRSTR